MLCTAVTAVNEYKLFLCVHAIDMRLPELSTSCGLRADAMVRVAGFHPPVGPGAPSSGGHSHDSHLHS